MGNISDTEDCNWFDCIETFMTHLILFKLIKNFCCFDDNIVIILMNGGGRLNNFHTCFKLHSVEIRFNSYVVLLVLHSK